MTFLWTTCQFVQVVSYVIMYKLCGDFHPSCMVLAVECLFWCMCTRWSLWCCERELSSVFRISERHILGGLLCRRFLWFCISSIVDLRWKDFWSIWLYNHSAFEVWGSHWWLLEHLVSSMVGGDNIWNPPSGSPSGPPTTASLALKSPSIQHSGRKLCSPSRNTFPSFCLVFLREIRNF